MLKSWAAESIVNATVGHDRLPTDKVIMASLVSRTCNTFTTTAIHVSGCWFTLCSSVQKLSMDNPKPNQALLSNTCCEPPPAPLPQIEYCTVPEIVSKVLNAIPPTRQDHGILTRVVLLLLHLHRRK